MPTQFPNLRTVPAYNHFLKERFERCLDLYLAPRQRKMKMNVNKEDLIPKLPSPKDLQPFPTFQGWFLDTFKRNKFYFSCSLWGSRRMGQINFCPFIRSIFGFGWWRLYNESLGSNNRTMSEKNSIWREGSTRW